MSIPIYQVDAFAERPFTGNPACVCLMQAEMPDDWMQNLAAEMNLSETAFVWKRNDQFKIRWFTPAAEVDLCGHATLAASHVLWEAGWSSKDTDVVFDSKSGHLSASRKGKLIVLDFPANPPTEVEAPAGLLQSLGVENKVIYIGSDDTDFIIEVDSEFTVRSLTPDFARLKHTTARGIIVTSQSDSQQYDFVSRFFGPAVGIDEDPVTGSAHTTMAPYWSRKLGRTEMKAFQASERGGSICIKIRENRVLLGGMATTIFRGELLI